MAALTGPRNTTKIDDPVIPRTMALPVAAATTIYAGSIVCCNAAGFAVPMTVSTTLRPYGRAKNTIVNAGGAGALTIEIDRGAFPYNMGTAGDALTIADRGNLVYGIDDNTVGKTNGTATRSLAGLLLDVVGTQAIVLIGGGPQTSGGTLGG